MRMHEAISERWRSGQLVSIVVQISLPCRVIVATPLKSVMTLEPFIGGACFVEINGRHDSGVLMIEYDAASQRLDLPRGAHEGGDAQP